ncbi:hypothetical protein [Stappia stellulata]|uniref:hypothetical protein n=1 Tax=Stappia stellulata TaxID=71235 RepID=UPI00041A2956|nr:hypothetical protein [Stappia stellulata]
MLRGLRQCLRAIGVGLGIWLGAWLAMAEAGGQDKPDAPMAAESRAFLDAYKIWVLRSGADLDATHEKSPFRPHLDWPLHKGLRGMDLRVFFDLQEGGWCWEMAMLAERAFLDAHPQLRAAFEDVRVSVGFTLHFVEKHTRAGRRCKAKEKLFDVMVKAPAQTGSWEPVELPGTADPDRLAAESARLGQPADLLRKRRDAYRGLHRLAFCEDYPPALRDMQTYLEVNEIALSAQDRQHLRARLSALGLTGATYEERIASMRVQAEERANRPLAEPRAKQAAQPPGRRGIPMAVERCR